MEKYAISAEDLIFEQHNNTKYTSNKTRILMENNYITLLNFPPQSPCLNSIEHLWQHTCMEMHQKSLVDLKQNGSGVE